VRISRGFCIMSPAGTRGTHDQQLLAAVLAERRARHAGGRGSRVHRRDSPPRKSLAWRVANGTWWDEL